MDRQLIIRPHADNFHVLFHNYMGPFEGRQIGKWLNLREIEDPPEDFDVESLQVGEYFMYHPMDRHPDLHALIPGDRLKDVAGAVDHFHVHVVEGDGILPELPPQQREEHSEFNYVEAIELAHQSVWSKGPMAVVQAFVIRAIPAVIVLTALLIGSRHWGDNRQDVGLAEVFARASRPVVQQGAFDRLWSPDHSHSLRTTISAVRCIEGEKLILEDGTVLRFLGMGEVRPMLEEAAMAGSLPRIEVDIIDNTARIAGIRAGKVIYGRGATLQQLARLGPTDAKPNRGNVPSKESWWQLDQIPDDASDALQGRRVSFVGTLERVDGAIELRAVGKRFRLRPVREFSRLDDFFDAVADGKAELTVDVVLDDFSPGGGVFAAGELYSISAQNYHIVARR